MEWKRPVRRKVEISRHDPAQKRDEEPWARPKKHGHKRHGRKEGDELQPGVFRRNHHAQEQGGDRHKDRQQIRKNALGLAENEMFVVLIQQRSQAVPPEITGSGAVVFCLFAEIHMAPHSAPPGIHKAKVAHAVHAGNPWCPSTFTLF
jgi:hypothetical protein